jgi:general secretion pathway protein G
MDRRRSRGFTLVEILIVVVILGVLSAIVVPQFTNATNETERTATLDQLVKLREAIDLYHVRNNAIYPDISPGVGDPAWGALIGPDYMRGGGINSWVGNAAGRTVVYGTGADTGYQSSYGWIYDPATGDLWAGSFDQFDQPFPRP